MHPTANIDSGHQAFEDLFFETFEGVDTGLARGVPRSPSPPVALDDLPAVTVHGDDLTSWVESVEARRPVIRPSTWHEIGPYPHSHRLGWWSPVPVTWELVGLNDQPEARESEEEVSEEEETDSEDGLRPSQMAMKKPVGAWGPAATGQGEGERSPSAGVPIADAPEEQQEEEEEEEEEDEDDDEYAPAAAPVRAVRRVAGGQQPARNSVAPAPAIANRKSSAWSAEEDAACIRLMKEVCTQAKYAAIASTEKRFEEVAKRMKREAGFARTASGVKIQWNRRLREASKFEDRGEKKRASGLTTSALGNGTKSGTRATTSLGAAPSSGTNASSSPAQSTETGDRQSIRKGKRKAIVIDSDDDNDDDFVSAPRLSKPSKRARSTSAESSSAVPSTQDVAYYALSTENIISGIRSSRHKRASSAITPARSSRQQPTTSDNDDDDDEEEVIPVSKPSARSNQKKRARTIEDDEEDEEPSTAAPQPKRAKASDEQPASDSQPKHHRMSSFDPVNKYSKQDGRLLDKKNKADYIEYINSSLHYTRPVSPEPAPNSKAYWEKKLRDRQAALAKQREEVERQRQAQRDEEEEDEDPVISTADKAKKGRALRKQFPNGMKSVFKSPSPAKSPPPAGPPSPVKPSSTTKSSSAISKSLPATNSFSIANPFGASMPAGMARPRIYTSTRPAPVTRPSLTGRTSSTVEPTPNMRPSLSNRLSGSTLHHSGTRPSSTTTSSSSVDNDSNAAQSESRSQQSSYFGLGRRFGEPRRLNRRPDLSPIAEHSERSIYPYEDENGRTIQGPQDVGTGATQIFTDAELARQLHEEINGPPSRSRRSRGFR